MKPYETTGHFLSRFFNTEHYSTAVRNARTAIAEEAACEQEFSIIKSAVNQRDFQPGQALKLVHESANQVLDENSESEAYWWLELMVKNIDKGQGEIEVY